jgi:predicted patatin/cPLA2 family phospholipase
MLVGHHEQEVLDLILARKAAGTRQDGRKLGLVVEGGAMRGVYTAGSLLALDLMKCNDVFDVVYGTSAGAVNAAHFLSLTGAPRAATYYKALADGKFFHPYRLWNVVDIDYFIFDVLQGTFPLDLAAAQKSSTPLLVALLDYDDATLRYFPIHDAGAEAWDLIKAAVAMPVVSRAPVRFKGRRYFDAGFAAAHGLQRALDDHCTHVLVLASRNLEFLPEKRTRIQRLLFQVFGARWNPALMRVFDSSREHLASLDRISSGRTTTERGAAIATFSPKPQNVRSATMNAGLLRDGVLQMAGEVLGALSHSSQPLEDAKSAGIL